MNPKRAISNSLQISGCDVVSDQLIVVCYMHILMGQRVFFQLNHVTRC